MRKTRIGKLLTAVAVTAALAAFGTTAWAEECNGENCNHVAAIGNKHYTDLQEALKECPENGKVTLLNDATIVGTNFSQDAGYKSGFALDLNEKKLTVNGQLLFYYNTTFTNGTIEVGDFTHWDGLLQAYAEGVTVTFENI